MDDLKPTMLQSHFSYLCTCSYLYLSAHLNWIKNPITFQYQTTPIKHWPPKIYFGTARTNLDWTFPNNVMKLSSHEWKADLAELSKSEWFCINHFWKLSFIYDANVCYLHQSITFHLLGCLLSMLFVKAVLHEFIVSWMPLSSW